MVYRDDGGQLASGVEVRYGLARESAGLQYDVEPSCPGEDWAVGHILDDD